jgi:hypothetical protein
MTLRRQFSLVLPVRRPGNHGQLIAKLTIDPWLCVPSFRLVCYYRWSGIMSTRGNGFRPMTLRTKFSHSEPFRSVAL